MLGFTENIKEYKLNAVALNSSEELNSGLWLVIAGINEIPPHIALIQDGTYYSVSTRKVDIGEPIEKFLKAISRRSLATLFISIKSSQSGGVRGAREAFELYPPLGNGDHSCLWPVRDFFAKAFHPDFSKCTLVFELLALAQKQNILIGCKSMFIEEGTLVLPKYTQEQIRDKINSILKVNE